MKLLLKYINAFLLSIALTTFYCLPIFAQDVIDTEEIQEEAVYEEESETSISDEESVLKEEIVEEAVFDDTDDNDQLFEEYVNEQFYGSDFEISNYALNGSIHTTYLNSNEQIVYADLLDKISKVANGELSDTVFYYDTTGINLTFTYEELGTTYSEFDKSMLSSKFEAFYEVISPSKIWQSLRMDCPYELYWHDKTPTTGGMLYGFLINKTSTYVSAKPYMAFSVSDDYWIEGTNTRKVSATSKSPEHYVSTTADTTKTGAASSAALNAQAIVDDAANLTDYEKLVSYKNIICDLVSYDHDAVNNDEAYGDPWQLIHVFDYDDETNVVCEGYSKAMQYLCDMSTFTNSITCYSAYGTTSGSHMWNVISINGTNYMADLTNQDANPSRNYFLVGYSSGSYLTGYKFSASSNTYTYDSDCKSVLGVSILTLSNTDYSETLDKKDIHDATCKLNNTSFSYTAFEIKPTVEISYESEVLEENVDYVLTYPSDLTSAGYKSITITGIGDYTGIVKKTYFVHDYDEEILAGYSLSLTGEIGMNFYMDLGQSYLSDTSCHMVFTNTLTGDVTKVGLNDAKKYEIDGETYYAFSYTVSVKDMTTPIEAYIECDKQQGETYTCTVEDYAEYLIDHAEEMGYKEKDVNIAKAMLTYGKYTQDYFEYNTSSEPTNINELTDTDLSEFAYSLDDQNVSISFVGARLLLTSTPGLKLYFRGSGTFYVDNQVVETTTEGNYTVLTINDVSDIYHMYNINCDGLLLEYSIASYGNLAMNGQNTSLQNLIQAMVSYYDYFVVY